MARPGRRAEALPLPNTPHQQQRQRRERLSHGSSGNKKSGGCESPYDSFSLAGTILLCGLGVALYAASSSLAVEQERDVRTKVDDTCRTIDAPPGAAPGAFSAAAVFASSAREFIDDELLASNSLAVHAELRELDAGAFPELAEEEGEWKGKGGDASLLPEGVASRSMPATLGDSCDPSATAEAGVQEEADGPAAATCAWCSCRSCARRRRSRCGNSWTRPTTSSRVTAAIPLTCVT
jgi:hypothetical protein